MSLIALIVILVFLAFLAYAVNAKAQITAGWKMLINTVLIITAVILVLVAFGIWDEIKNVKVPKL